MTRITSCSRTSRERQAGLIDTIYLVGRSPTSRHLIKEIPEDALIYTIAACWDLPPRIDKCVDIHPRWLLENERYAPPMWKWLQEPRDFPVYMQEAHADIPGSEPYPIDEIIEMVPVFRWDEMKRNKFLSSSFDYLLALAILDRPKRIVSIGYDMSSDTEYRYQREGAAFWLGVAAGMGIEVVLPDECPMLEVDMLYGYEGAQAIKWSRLEELSVLTKKLMTEAELSHQEQIDRMPVIERMEDAQEKEAEIQTIGQTRDEFFVYSGAWQAVGELMNRFAVGDIVFRQELEVQRVVSLNEVNRYLSLLNFWEGVVRDRQQRLQHNNNDEENRRLFTAELQEAYVKQAQTRDEYMTWKGGQQLLEQLIRECDIQHDEDWKPVATIQQMSINTMEGTNGS